MSQLKDQIIKKSLEMFLTLGFKSVTMDDIAAKLGMSKKTLYTHFKNKQELVAHASLHMCNTIYDGVDHIIEQYEDKPIEELYAVKRFVMEEMKGDQTSSIHQLQRYYPEAYKPVHDIKFHYMDSCIKKNVNNGIKLGVYRNNVNPDFIARIYFIGMQGIKDISIFPTNEFPVNDLYDDYLEYHLRGILTPKGRQILNQIINSNHD
ncbi:MAG: TetR/AcrR family transcriptional regulator [Bacteroidota bacterium]|nr:TetR/AcrR family transcriptional regulator [Bacteroidota bacterium]